MGVVEFKNFSWAYSGYNTPIIKNVNLTINKGEFIGVLGSVGGGRTSLCNTFLGLIPHFYPGNMKGDVIIDGLSVKESKISELSTKVGLIFQSPENQLTGAGMSVEEELAFGLENLGVKRSEIKERINSMIKLIDLKSFRKRNPFELSGGQQQKVAIASVLIMNPKVLVLDEPTAQLDPLGTEQVFSLIKKLTKKGMTIFLVSNKLDYLAEFADKILIFNNEVKAFDETRKILTDIKLLKKHHIKPSVITQLSSELKKEGLWKRDLCLNLTEAKKMLKQVLK